MITFARLATSGLVGVLLLAPLVVTPDAAQAEAQSTPADSVTWSVEPADADGATGRAWLELTLEAGESVTEHMLITNRGATDVTFHLSAADGYFTETGRFTMLPAGEASTDAGTWITIPATASVGAGQSVIVPFEVDVPADATPGDHPAGVAAGIRTGDETLGVESRVGFRVMTRVHGDLTPGLTVADQSAVYVPSWNPFLPGSLRVTATVVNSGNTRLGAQPGISTAGPLGVFTTETALPDLPEFAPGESRAVTGVVANVWPAFATSVRIRAVAVEVDGVGAVLPLPAEADTVVATVPWSQLALILVLALAAILLFWRGRTRKKSVARMIDAAREEGRRQGAMTGAGLLGALIVAGGLVLASPSPSSAEEPAGGVSVEVDVTPLPTASAPGVPVPAVPVPERTTEPQDHAPLAKTGIAYDPGFAVLAGGLLLAGTVAGGAALRRSSRTASDGAHRHGKARA